MRRFFGLAAVVAIAAIPPQAESVPAFPLFLEAEICWDFAPCAVGLLVLFEDRTCDGDGDPCVWSFSRPTLTFEFPGMATYTGVHAGGRCFEGTMTDAFGSGGTWNGCMFI